MSAHAKRPLERWDVVVVPFPFSERPVSKRRPALVLSHSAFNAHGVVVLAMVTSAIHEERPGDVAVGGLSAAGLQTPSVIRWKIFTLDTALVLRTAGHLSAEDQAAASEALHEVGLAIYDQSR